MARSARISSSLALLAFVALCFGTAWVASQHEPGAWYAALEKPSWNPPAWIFAPVWAVLYLAMAVAAWLVWRRRQRAAVAVPLTIFFVQLVLNAAWSWIFFGLHRMDWAFLEIVILEAAILATVVLFWRIRPLTGALLVPYAAWVAFAAVLNFTLWRMNAP